MKSTLAVVAIVVGLIAGPAASVTAATPPKAIKLGTCINC